MRDPVHVGDGDFLDLFLGGVDGIEPLPRERFRPCTGETDRAVLPELELCELGALRRLDQIRRHAVPKQRVDDAVEIRACLRGVPTLGKPTSIMPMPARLNDWTSATALSTLPSAASFDNALRELLSTSMRTCAAALSFDIIPGMR